MVIQSSFSGNARRMKYLKFLSGGQKAVVSLAFILALQVGFISIRNT